MNKRISISKLEPEAYKAMLALENYCKGSGLDRKLVELVKIRASQINGCAYCVDMHSEDSLKLGESERRLFALSVWKESHLFSAEERTALQLCEEITHISNEGLREESYQKAIDTFGEQLTAQLIMQIVLINAWNRIAVSTKAVYKK